MRTPAILAFVASVPVAAFGQAAIGGVLSDPSCSLVVDFVYNALNPTAVLTYNNTFVRGGPWLQPLTILAPRLFTAAGEVEW